ncbi:phospholipase A [Maribellus sp. YY47]|uniref:phospholipase A n=1 Tax=Maribellus sp. YY47 TaxID=2929486 RepID=UPI002000BE2D|nr:phospholipase A [Maribellus sp. YY47]MCK3683101.1 phospholipase A [Maribellus sp. YY47]
MRKRNYIISLFLVSIYSVSNLHAQDKEVEELWKNQIDTGRVVFTKSMYLEINEQQVLDLLDRQPSFGMYKDNYFTTGVPTNKKIDQYSADAKFQISIRQRLTKTVLPFNSLLMLTYTQKSFWDIYQDSYPFADNNYNPGLALAKPIVVNNKLGGIGILAFEHESNGIGDSLKSRSWNYFVFTGTYFYNMYFTVQAKVWAGGVSDDNPDLLAYRGYGLVAVNYRSKSDRLWISAIVNPLNNLTSFNTQLELNFKIAPKFNQYLFVQWYNGYGERLLEYNQYTSMIRIGICIKPPLRNIY